VSIEPVRPRQRVVPVIWNVHCPYFGRPQPANGNIFAKKWH